MKSKWLSLVFLLLLITISNCSSNEMTDTYPLQTAHEPSKLSLKAAIGESTYTFDEPKVVGRTFYIDPVAGSMQGDGSESNPWSTLQDVIENNLVRTFRHKKDKSQPLVSVNENAPVRGGDRLILKGGYHGTVLLNYFYFEDWLTIEGAPGERAVLSKFAVDGVCEKLYLKNISIIRDSYKGVEHFWESPEMKKHSNALLHFSSSNYWGEGSNIKLNQLELKTTNAIDGWTLEDWKTKTATGIILRNITNMEIMDSSVENVDFGMVFDFNSDNTRVVGNSVKNFTKDGMQIISNNMLLENNLIENALKIDGNHDDGIQIFTRGNNHAPGGGALRNVVIRGNRIIAHRNDFDFENIEKTSLQGIGGFDGIYDNFTIENNIVVANNHHGITLLGATNCKIANNTVIDQDRDDYTPLYIFIGNHKNGQKSENCIIANNIVSSGIRHEGGSVKDSHNLVLGKYDSKGIYDIFEDPDNFDFHLMDNDTVDKKIIDAGINLRNLTSSKYDYEAKVRTSIPDLGAYEHGAQ